MIGSSFTQNKLPSLPAMAAYMTGFDPAPERQHGVNVEDRRTYLEQGGVYPTDVKAIRRIMAIPYNMQMELAIATSNTDQMFQILEQILLVFDYDMQLQLNDAFFDWGKIQRVLLISSANEEVYPAGTEKRSIIYTLSFTMETWLQPPMDVRNDVIKSITLTFGEAAAQCLNEIDENGNFVPFDEPWAQTVVSAPEPLVGADPGACEPVELDHFDPATQPCRR